MAEPYLSESDLAIVSLIVRGPGVFHAPLILRTAVGSDALTDATHRNVVVEWDEFIKATHGIERRTQITLSPWTARLVRVQIAERLILIPGMDAKGDLIEVIEERPFWAAWPKEKRRGEWVEYAEEDDPYVDLGLVLPQILAVELPQRHGEFSQPYLDHLPDPRSLPDRSGLRPMTRAQRRAGQRRAG